MDNEEGPEQGQELAHGGEKVATGAARRKVDTERVCSLSLVEPMSCSRRTRNLSALLPLLCAASAVLTPLPSARAQGQTIGAPPEQNRFTRKVLVDGLDEPMQLEFDRAGRVYFIERKGAVKRYDERTGRVATLGRIPVAVVGEAGLIGLLLDRDFERTRQLYLYFSSAGATERDAALALHADTARQH